jgi:carboxymethylenebutenolidase
MHDTNTEIDGLLPALKLTRRGFIATSLAGGFTLAAGPIAAQTVVHTDSDGLVAGEIKIPVPDGDMPAYRAAPAGKTDVPVIVVVQEVFGVHEYIRDVCRRYAKLGYMAIAPELYARQGDPSKYTDLASLYSNIVNKVPDEQVMGDIDATVKWAGSHGGSKTRLGINGFCWGGRIVWLYTAHNPKMKAAVVWYGRLVGDKDALHPINPIDVADKVRTPVLGMYGGQDSSIPLTSINAMKEALAKRPAPVKEAEFVVFRNAGHAFHADYRPSYRADAAKEGWQDAVDWFHKYL